MPDQEIILGKGLLLGLFFGLVGLCGVFFSLGYSVGKNSTAAALTPTQSAKPSSSSPDADKPAAPLNVVIRKPGCGSSPEGCAPSDNSAAATPPPVANPSTSAKPPRVEAAANAGQGDQAKSSTGPAPALAATEAPTEGYVVQVAAVSKQQDADALVAALKKKQYQVFVATAATDNLFHVQIGPFDDPKGAEAVRTRLIADGYTPIVKKI